MARVVERRQLPSALERWPELQNRLRKGPFAVFLDYDGTLTAIAARPDLATLPERSRGTVRALAARVPVAVVTGRALADVRALVAVDGLYYAGNHGFEIEGPGASHRAAPELRETFDRLAGGLEPVVEATAGSTMEAKGYSVAVHYRGVDEGGVEILREAIHAAAGDDPRIRVGFGKKVFELRPNFPWHKGKAVRWLVEHLAAGGPPPTPVFIGDDLTDEDALAEIREDGIGIRVGPDDTETAARYRLEDPAEVREFLERLGEVTR